MKKLLCVSFSMLLLGNSFAQTSTHRWSAAVNGNYKEYKGDLGKTLLQFRFPNFQVGGGVSRYLNSWIDLIGMQYRIVLDIAPCPHPDLVGIAAQNRTKPYTGLIGQMHIANDMRPPGNKDSIAFNR